MKRFYPALFLLVFSGCGRHNPLPSDPITGYIPAPAEKTARPEPAVQERNEDPAVPEDLQSTRALVQSVKHRDGAVMFVLNERAVRGEWPKRTYYYPVYRVDEDDLVDEAGKRFTIGFQDYLLVHWYEKDGERLVWSVRVLRRGHSRR